MGDRLIGQGKRCLTVRDRSLLRRQPAFPFGERGRQGSRRQWAVERGRTIGRTTVFRGSREQLTRAAIEAGVSAYVVDGLRPERIKPVLDAAIARFHMFQRMRAELAATKAALEERKIIDRAKAILMKARGIDEEAAYALLRKTAMDQGKRVADIAQQLVLAAGLLT